MVRIFQVIVSGIDDTQLYCDSDVSEKLSAFAFRFEEVGSGFTLQYHIFPNLLMSQFGLYTFFNLNISVIQSCEDWRFLRYDAVSVCE